MLRQVRRWQEEGGMHVLSGSRTFQAREMSGGYKHPQKLPGLTMSFEHGGAPAASWSLKF